MLFTKILIINTFISRCLCILLINNHLTHFVTNITYCNKKILHKSILMDGIKDVKIAERIYEPCETASFVDIILEVARSISYIVVYEGSHLKNKFTKGLDYFSAALYTADSQSSIRCASYPKKSVGPVPGKGMRINCQVDKANEIIIYSTHNRGLSICEIELMTLNWGTANAIFNGCFSSFMTMYRTVYTYMRSCLEICSIQYNMASVNAEDDCLCGVIPHSYERLPLKRCNILDRGYNLGGENAFAVYLLNIQLPFHVGCVIHKEDNIMQVYEYDNMTIIKCILACGGYTFPGVMGGSVCLCTKYGYSPDHFEGEKCNMPCEGDNESICGGPNHISLYGSMTKRYRSIIDLLVESCDGELNYHGECTGKCKERFDGLYCLNTPGINSCELQNPCLNESNAYCVVSDNSLECYCNAFYVRKSTNDPCERHVVYYIYTNYSKTIMYVAIGVVVTGIIVWWIKS